MLSAALARVLAAFLLPVFAGTSNPVRDLKKYPSPTSELVFRVKSARIVMANYELLKQDFPELRKKTRAEIDAWLLDKAGYMAATQVRNPIERAMNTPIDADYGDSKQALRPEGYGRALVFDLGGGRGLIDGKGFGARDPRPGLNSTGLMMLEEAMREYVFENIVSEIFKAHGGKFETVGTYAVIDWGFDAKSQVDGEFRAAGAVLRQGHQRETWNFNNNLPRELALEIELLLRQYGITTAGLSESLRRQAQVPYDLINVQGKRSGDGAVVVDFGAYVRVPKGYVFTKPIAVRENRFYSPGVVNNEVGGNRETAVLSGVMSPDDPRFVAQATDETRVPPEHFAALDAAKIYPDSDALTMHIRRWVAEMRRKLGCERQLIP